MHNQGYKLSVGREDPVLFTSHYRCMPHFEGFDFKKEGDLKKFNDLHEEEKQAHIGAAYEEATSLNDSLDRFSEAASAFGLSVEEAKIARQRTIDGERPEDAIRAARIETKTEHVGRLFNERSASEITNDDVAELRQTLQEIEASHLDQYLPHDSYGGGRTREDCYFSQMSSNIRRWHDTNHFRDKETLRFVAIETTDVFIDRARNHHKAPYGSIWGQPLKWLPDPIHMWSSEAKSAHFLGELGFFDDGFKYLEVALGRRYGGDVLGGVRKDLREFLASYRASGQRSGKGDAALKQEIENVLSDTLSMLQRERHGAVGTSSGIYDRVLDIGQEKLAQMGFTNEDRKLLLKDAYEKAADIYLEKEQFSRASEMYRLVGQEAKANVAEHKFLLERIKINKKAIGDWTRRKQFAEENYARTGKWNMSIDGNVEFNKEWYDAIIVEHKNELAKIEARVEERNAQRLQ